MSTVAFIHLYSTKTEFETSNPHPIFAMAGKGASIAKRLQRVGFAGAQSLSMLANQ